jgi:hypothetical protein
MEMVYNKIPISCSVDTPVGGPKVECNNKVTRAMAQVVLNDILKSVIDEFEKNADIQIGAIRINPKTGVDGRREISVEVVSTGERCISGLVHYKKLLCQHEPFRDSRLCHMD